MRVAITLPLRMLKDLMEAYATKMREDENYTAAG
jgi:hypothetical protein